MLDDLALRDKRNNLVISTLFESYLAKFILEHPDLYKAAYLKLLDAIEQDTARDEFDRLRFSVFSILNENYPNYLSIADIHKNFYLPAADFIVKLAADYLYPPPKVQLEFFSATQSFSRSPINYHRNPHLFSEENRGVSELDGDEVLTTKDLGIVEAQYRPQELLNYFSQEIEPSMNSYVPLESSSVAKLLRSHECPVIAGSSGSTEALISRLFLLTHLTPEEKHLLIFSQACNMIANGHHSLLESMIVANALGVGELNPQASQRDFYLQCVPPSIQAHPNFIEFINSKMVAELLSGIDSITTMASTPGARK